MKLYSYYRSSAAYRVRIALALKGLSYRTMAIDLSRGAQRSDDYLATNPQGLVPALELDDGRLLTQSLAILEWLNEAHPEPAFYADDGFLRATQRSLVQHIACDIHPLNNLRILRYLKGELEQPEDAVSSWYAHWVRRGFDSLEEAIANFDAPFSMGSRPGMVEVMVIPQVYNARRFNVPIEDYEHLLELDARCQELDAFRSAHPSAQPDAPESLSAR